MLPDDEHLVSAFNAAIADGNRLRPEVIPQPFLGRASAPVVLLGLNPGFVPEDIAQNADPWFLSIARANLAHADADYPFYLLHPKLEGRPGKKWWDQRLGAVLTLRSREAVARSILCVEYFPYHSERYRAAKLLFPSQEYSFGLVREAMRRSALIVMMRGMSRWYASIPELASYGKLLRLNSSQNVTISPKNCPGFDWLVGAIG